MKKSTVRVTIIMIVCIVALVGYYAYLTGTAKSAAEKAVMTPVQKVLNRDMEYDYPATPKEVVKYYTDIEKCFYNEDCSEEDIEALGMRARVLYDDELLAINETGTYLNRLKSDIQDYKEHQRKISSAMVAASTNVDFFSEDGFEFARLYCGYTLSEKGVGITESKLYLLRRDSNRKWKIYGWQTSGVKNPGAEE